MRRLSSLAVLALLSLSSPALAYTSAPSSTGAETVTATLVRQAQATQTAEVTPAQPPTPDTSTDVTLGEVVKLGAQALASKNWGLLACAVVLGAVHLVRRFGASRWPWLSSDGWGVGLSLVVAAVVKISAALASGTPITLSLVLGALLTAAGASGLFSWAKKLSGAKQPGLAPAVH